MLRPAATAIVLIASCSLIACDSSQRRPNAPDADVVTSENYPKVTLQSPLNSDHLVVDYTGIIIDAPTSTRPLRAQVPVRSIADQQFLVQYRFLWFDDTGRNVGETGWRFTPLDVAMQAQFSGAATTLSATDWRLEIRPSR
jgi:uncharacterized protein YcfL